MKQYVADTRALYWYLTASPKLVSSRIRPFPKCMTASSLAPRDA
jgi:hypothetical protein